MFPEIEKMHSNVVYPASSLEPQNANMGRMADWNSSNYSVANGLTIASPATIGNWTTLTILAHNGSSPYKPNSHITLAEETTIEGYTFPALTKITFDDRGELDKAALPSDGVINGIRFKGYPYKIEFWEGKLTNGTLAGDQVIQGINCADGSIVRFHDTTGKISMVTKLATEQKIQGVVCAKGSQAEFFRNGNLDSAYLARDQMIQGVMCGRSTLNPIRFYARDGQLFWTYLSGDQTIQGHECHDGCVAEFESDGKLRSCD